MFKKIKNIFSLLNKKNKISLFFVILLAFISSVFDLIGVVSVLPFLSLLVNPALINESVLLQTIASSLNFNNQELLIFLGFSSFFLIFLNQIIRFISKMFTIKFSRELIYEMTGDLFDYYLRQPFNFFSKQNKSLLIQKCTSYVEHFIAGTLSPYTHIFSQILTTSIIFIFLIFYQPTIIIILSISLITYYFLFYKKVGKKFDQISKNYSKYFENFSRSLGDAFGVIHQLKLFKNDYFKKNFSNSANLYKKAHIYQNFYSLLPSHFIEVFAYGGILLISTILLYQSQDLKNIIPVLGIIVVSLRRIIPGIQEIYLQSLQIKVHVQMYNKIYSDLKRIRNLKIKKIKNNKTERLDFKKIIQIQNLKYRYKNSANKINITTSINNGEFIGICGKTGVGKSTLVNILSGLVKKESGKIFLDGNVTETFENEGWKKKIGYATQERYIINDTIINNISLGDNKKNSLFEIKKLCKIVELDQHIKNFKSGYKTRLGDSGIKLSGGQEQKIIIARALYNKPKILIFDEATNALDPISEVKILKNIRKKFKGLTLIFVTHRLNSLRRCDKIIFLENSKVKKSGKFDKLLKTDKNFYSLITAYNN